MFNLRQINVKRRKIERFSSYDIVAHKLCHVREWEGVWVRYGCGGGVLPPMGCKITSENLANTQKTLQLIWDICGV